MSRTILLTGRIVSGHPMEQYAVTDDRGQPKLNKLGEPRMQTNVGLAIPKTAGVDWKAEPWGKEIVAAAVEGWPNGEHNAPTFAWKVTDGDSQVPNQKGNKPCDREGYPGNWVVFASHELGPVRCFHNGKFQPHEVIQDKAEVKCGDYGRLNVQVVANAPAKSPGVYINPDMFALDRPGEVIVSAAVSNAADVFGSGAPVATPAAGSVTPPSPQTAVSPVGVAPQSAAPVAPDPSFLEPAAGPVMLPAANGITYEAYKAQGWTDEQLVANGFMQAPT